MVTCEMKLFWNDFEITSVFLFHSTINHGLIPLISYALLPSVQHAERLRPLRLWIESGSVRLRANRWPLTVKLPAWLCYKRIMWEYCEA